MVEDQTIGDKFTPEARAELLAMYTGMALQGILANSNCDRYDVGAEAVRYAEQTVSALESHHINRAKLEAADVGAAQ